MRIGNHLRIKRDGAKGSALITVTFIGLFVMLLAAALVNYFATNEARAIAESLAKTRIYWASMGHINYALSRVSREGLCNGTCVNDEDRADTLRNFLLELYESGNERIWDFGDNYSFRLTATVTDGPLPVPDNNDGRVRAAISLLPIAGSTYDVLNGIEQRMRENLAVDICLAPCSTDPGQPTSGVNRIEALHRQ